MKNYTVVASPIRGQKITKHVAGVPALRSYLSECRDMGYEVKDVRRQKQPIVQSLAGLFHN